MWTGAPSVCVDLGVEAGREDHCGFDEGQGALLLCETGGVWHELDGRDTAWLRGRRTHQMGVEPAHKGVAHHVLPRRQVHDRGQRCTAAVLSLVSVMVNGSLYGASVIADPIAFGAEAMPC